MNKKEWKVEYSAARLLLNARFSRFDKIMHSGRPEQKRVFDICYSTIMKMHESIEYAMFGKAECFYSIKKFKWAAKHNSRQFHAIRVKNEIDRIKRKEHNND